MGTTMQERKADCFDLYFDYQYIALQKLMMADLINIDPDSDPTEQTIPANFGFQLQCEHKKNLKSVNQIYII